MVHVVVLAVSEMLVGVKIQFIAKMGSFQSCRWRGQVETPEQPAASEKTHPISLLLPLDLMGARSFLAFILLFCPFFSSPISF